MTLTPFNPVAPVLANLSRGHLPEFEPDPALWSRIAAARGQALGRQRRRRAVTWGAGFALAASLLVVIVIGARPQPTQLEAGVDWQQRAQALEQRWQTQRRAAAMHPETRAQLRAIDRALQAAYDRGGVAEELAPLWQQRSEALLLLLSGETVRTAALRI